MTPAAEPAVDSLGPGAPLGPRAVPDHTELSDHADLIDRADPTEPDPASEAGRPGEPAAAMDVPTADVVARMVPSSLRNFLA